MLVNSRSPRALRLAAAVACLATGIVYAQALTSTPLSSVPGIPGPRLPVSEQSGVRADQPLNPALPTIFIVSDSTARNGKDLGWGDHFAHYHTHTSSAGAEMNAASVVTAIKNANSPLVQHLALAVGNTK